MANSRPSSSVFWVLAIAILVGASWIRIHNAQTRQFHADEGVQAYQAWRLVESENYRYDPREHHGPTLYYLAKWLHPVLADGAGEFSDFRIRVVPLVFGVATLALCLLALRGLGGWKALGWGGLAAAAPLPVIYGAYFVQESLLAFFTFGLIFAVFRYVARPGFGWALAVGASAGLMVATKETAALHFAALGVALVVVFWKRSMPWRRYALEGSVAIGVALAIAALFFTSFGANPGGALDAAAAFFHYADRAQGQGHEKPFFYYLGLLLPHSREGIRWSELALVCSVGLGLAAKAFKWRQIREAGSPLGLGLAVFGVGLFLVYSIIPYKTPWLLLTPYLALLYVAVDGLAECGARAARGRVAWVALGVAGSLWLAVDTGRQSRKAVFVYPSASRNPYLYEHTTSRYPMLLERILELRERAADEGWSLGVYSPDHSWPLPWHLRKVERVGYWKSLDSFTPHAADAIDTRLLQDELPEPVEGETWELYGLRPNTLISLRITDAPPFVEGEE